uniref:cytochrome b561 isoform X1 n=1 Tax=Ciona intestinalis TaxID=7719 RepID=UPI000EF4B4B4|nr:cytochrome b561 isoform X1 [Ciona intestinalis]|eukprot:XP_026691139.1 cytochrome b561 isoform X1 [Ciona intestinalis]
MSSINELEDMDKLRGLSWMVALSQGLGITMVVLMGVWLNTYMGGFAWDGSGKEFNLHPLCMICGMVFLYGEAALVYRVFRQTEKLKAKIIHGSLLLLAFIAVVVGLVAVFQFHNHGHITNMYSLHSWCGMTTVILFCLQFLIGFLSFLLPGARPSIRKFYLPIHQFFGGAILVLSLVSVISGLDEKLIFKLNQNGDESRQKKKRIFPSISGPFHRDQIQSDWDHRRQTWGGRVGRLTLKFLHCFNQ